MKRKKRLLQLMCFVVLAARAQEPLQDYIFFANSRMMGDYYYTKTISRSPSVVTNSNRKLPVSETIFHTPGNALKLEYVNGKGGSWQAILYKPEIRGQDHFKPARFLSFHYYIAGNTGNNSLPAVRLIKRDSSLSNAISLKSGKPGQWSQIIIPVESFTEMDLSDPVNAMGIVFSQGGEDGKKHLMYIDDVEFLADSNAAAVTNVATDITCVGYAKHIDISWTPVTDANVKYVQVYRSLDGKTYKPIGVQVPSIYRYADYVGETGKTCYYKIAFLDKNYQPSVLSKAASASTRSMTDDELLTMVQEACFRYYWDGAEPTSGLARENTLGRSDMVAAGASGFGIMALVVGTERKFITREQSVERFLRIVSFLEKAETFHGVYPHFIDGPTGKVEPFFGNKDNGADLVETSFLMQGLLAARQYFSGSDPNEKIIRDKINAIWQKAEWDWFKQRPDSKFLYWHWSPDQAWVINHTLIGWNETMVTYLLAIASPTHGVPASMYYTGWANQDSTGQKYRSGWGQTKEGSMYTNGNTYFGVKLDVGVSNGGPLFFTHYSYLGYDPHFITDKYTNYFTNNKNIATINYRYCVQNPKHYKGYGDNAWGLTASDGPVTYYPDEPVPREDHGKITPTGAIGSFPYLPNEAMKALKNYYFNYGKFLWGEYGFKDSFDPTNNWCSDIYMGLNQGPMTVMIENHRTGLIWKLFMSSPEIQEGLRKLGEEKTK